MGCGVSKGKMLRTHKGFTLLDVFLAEEELAIEVGEVDGVEVE